MFKKRNAIRRTGMSIAVMLLIFAQIHVYSMCAAESVTLSLSRELGTALGSKIQGNFKAIGKGSAGIVRMEFLINGEIVAESDSNRLEYRFNTADFEIGDYNLTMIGYDALENAVQDTELVEFLSPSINIIIILIIVPIVGLSIWFKYIKPRRKPVQKTDVGIEKL
jgi:hypothetical protein